ncbi:MAG: transposase [Thermomicrobiales bacterium]
MTYPPTRHRRSIRLRGYNYTRAGAYFITICSRDRVCIFADIADGETQLTSVGEVVASCWEAIPEHFPTADLDACVVTPNHLHGIVVLGTGGTANEGTACRALVSDFLGPLPQGHIPSLWQSNYHEHVIRDERSLERLRAYIAANPARWTEDSLHPDHPDTALPIQPRIRLS